MTNALRRFYDVLRDEGPRTTARRSLEFGLRKLYFTVSENPRQMYIDSVAAVAAEEDINICYNRGVREQYDESKTNVLILTEGPNLIEAEDWLDQSFDFHAEYSYGDFYSLDNFFSLRRKHAGRDYRIELDTSNEYTDKPDLVSIVFADKDRFPGQAMRHEVIEQYGDVVNGYGSGVGSYLYDKSKSLDSYMYQIAIESGRYPEYVDAKFFDCLKTYTIPIYRGGQEAVEKMGFDTDGILFFENLDELGEILKTLSPEKYQRLRPHAEANRKRLIEIRNEMRREFYFDYVRLAAMETSDDLKFEDIRHLLRFE